jgi:TPR repeat protein
MLAETADEGEYLQAVGRVKVAATDSRAALLERSCAGGLGVACERIAYREEAKRARLVERACALGWGLACLHIGKQLEQAGGRAKAIPRYEEACRLGLRTVCSELATILSTGDGVPVDHEGAVRVEAMSWRAR